MRKSYIVLILLLLPKFAFGFSGSGAGTSNSPYLITSADELFEVRSDLSAYYKLMNDIDLESWITENSPTLGWAPIGTTSTPFVGHFDGNKKLIKNLYINRENSDYIGLFGVAINAEIHDVGIINPQIVGDQHVSAIVGYRYVSTSYDEPGKGTLLIENCYVVGGYIKGHYGVGGIIGYNYGYGSGNSLQIQSCHCSAKIIGTQSCGGICGHALGYGSSGISIQDSYFVGEVSGKDYTGGIIGNLVTDYGWINKFDRKRADLVCQRNYVRGNILGQTYTNGIAGYVEAKAWVPSQWGSPVDGVSIMTNNVCIADTIQGQYRICSYVSSADNYASTKTIIIQNGKAQEVQDNSANGTAMGIRLLQKASTYESLGWSFSSTWKDQYEQEDFPIHQTQTNIPIIEAFYADKHGLIKGTTMFSKGQIFVFTQKKMYDGVVEDGKWMILLDKIIEGEKVVVVAREDSRLPSSPAYKYAEYDTTLRPHLITFLNYDSTIIQSNEVLYGQIPSLPSITPQKPSTDKYTYIFKEWYPKITNVKCDADYIATYDSIINQYKISFLNYNNDTLQSSMVYYGKMPKYLNDTPICPSNKEHSFIFKGWKPDIKPVTKKETYMAQYDTIPRQCQILFQDYDSTIISLLWQTLGEMPILPPNPSRPPNAHFSYVFMGWSPQVTMITDDVIYTAVYDSVVNEYQISFINYNQELLQKSKVPYGEIPMYKGKTNPSHASDVEHSYIFAGWSPDIVPVTEDAVYTAIYDTTINKYLVTFVNYDSTILQSAMLEYNAIPEYKGPIPTREKDEANTYTWKGWSPAIVPVTKDAIYIALYDAKINEYRVTFINYNNDTLQTNILEYGAIPQYYGTAPQRPSDIGYHYTFNGWNPQITMVKSDVIYKAMFDSIPNPFNISFRDYDGSLILDTIIYYGQMPIPPKDPIRLGNVQYSYNFRKWIPEISFVVEDAIYTAEYDTIINTYQISFVNYDSTVLQTYQLEYDSIPKYTGETPVREKDRAYTYTWRGWSPAIVPVKGDATYMADYDETINQYTLELDCSYGYATGSGIYDYGSTVMITAIPLEHYHFVEWSDGNKNNPRLIYVNGDFVLHARIEYDTFSITTLETMHGHTTGGGQYEYGSFATLVAYPDEGYVFDGWDNGSESNPYVVYVETDMNIMPLFSTNNYDMSNGETICMVGRQLHVENVDQPYDVYDIHGLLIYHGMEPIINLPARGIYLVITQTNATKIIVQ